MHCPVEQAEPLFTELKIRGPDVELIRFEGEPRGRSRRNRPPVLLQLDRALQKGDGPAGDVHAAIGRSMATEELAAPR